MLAGRISVAESGWPGSVKCKDQPDPCIPTHTIPLHLGWSSLGPGATSSVSRGHLRLLRRAVGTVYGRVLTPLLMWSQVGTMVVNTLGREEPRSVHFTSESFPCRMPYLLLPRSTYRFLVTCSHNKHHHHKHLQSDGLLWAPLRDIHCAALMLLLRIQSVTALSVSSGCSPCISYSRSVAIL